MAYKTKTQKKRALESIMKKVERLYFTQTISIKDVDAINRICNRALGKL